MRALILGNGSPPPLSLFTALHAKSSLLIAADGGGNWCMEQGVEPDVVVGDIDSFDVDLYPSMNVIKDADQETNDLEKAMNLALERGVTDVLLAGTTGLRLDQTLKNISVLVQFRTAFNSIKMFDALGWMVILPEEYAFSVSPGTTVSLFPVSGRVDGISTEGLEFALHNEFLQNGIRDGSSNKSISDTVRIVHTKGDLLLMVYDENRSLGKFD